MQLFSKAVGIGSSSEDLQGADKTSRRTSSSEEGARICNSLWTLWMPEFTLTMSECTSELNEERMMEILSRKYDPNCSAREWIEEQSGSRTVGRRCRISLKAFQRDR